MRVLLVADLLFGFNISYDIAEFIKAILESHQHEVAITDIGSGGSPGQDRNFYYSDLLRNIDVVLYPSIQKVGQLPPNDLVKQFDDNLRAIRNGTRDTVQIVPVRIGNQIWLPSGLINLHPVDIPLDFSSISSENLEPFFLKLMKNVSEQADISAREVAETQKAIEEKAELYIAVALRSLKRRELNFSRGAIAGYAAGFICIIIAIYIAIHYTTLGLDAKLLSTKNIWPVLVYYALRGFTIIGLLIAASRYAFIIAQASMNESLRNADRIHAISFGEFYITAYPNRVNWDQLKEAFQYWNINSAPGFGTAGATDYEKLDPKLLETICTIAGAVVKK